jgi:type I restriction enzyme, S subunit
MVPLGELMAPKSKTVNPAKVPDESFELYSIPAFDAGCPEVALGEAIGSSKKVLEPGDVLLSKIVPHIRRVWAVGEGTGRRKIGSSEWIIFRTDQATPGYLRHLLASDPVYIEFMRTVSGVGGSLLRARPSLVANINVPLPPVEEQRRLAAILDAADELRAKRRESLALLDSLTDSILRRLLDEASGADWPIISLGEIGEIQGGLQVTRARARFPIEVPYLRVANVYRGRLDLREVKCIRVTKSELERTSLVAGDLLIVEGHGNRAEIGRVGRWNGEVDVIVHQNHLIRARLDTAVARPRFVEAFLNCPVGRQSLLRAARTTSGLNTISTSDVKSALVLLPPLAVQKQFTSEVDEVARVRSRSVDQLDDLDSLFSSLQHRAFRGEL